MDAGLHRGFFVGECRIDPLTSLIETPAGPQRVQPKVMEVLVCLAASPGEVVTRDVLIEQVWGGRPASDEVLTRCVSELRHALDDHADKPKYIQTIPKRGYRLVSPVRPAMETDSTGELREGGLAARSWRVRISYGIGLVFAVFCGALVYYFLNPLTSTFAFGPRDWVLVSFQNQTEDPVFDALDEAFRIALQQSRYANLFPESQVRDSLRRMSKDSDAPIDRAVGIEVAKREGIRALVLGSIAQIGDTFSITAEVVDPERDRSVFTESAVSPSLNDVLVSLETVTSRLRRKLGESLQSIEETAMPLAQVATPDLEALRAYSMALAERMRGRSDQAILLLERAIEIDPMFAAAHSKLGTIIYGSTLENERALEHWTKALQIPSRLTTRDRLYIEGSKAWFSDPDEMIRRWNLLTSLYPDEATGHHNIGMVHWHFRNDFAKAIESFSRATAIPNPWRAASFYYLAYCQLGAGDFKKSVYNFAMAEELAGYPMNFGLADAYTAQKLYSKALGHLNGSQEFVSPSQRFSYAQKLIAYHIDRGQFAEARDIIDEHRQLPRSENSWRMLASLDMADIAIAELLGDSERLGRLLDWATEQANIRFRAHGSRAGLPPLAEVAVLGSANARHGRIEIAEEALDLLTKEKKWQKFPVWLAAVQNLAAEIALARGEAEAAIQHVNRALHVTDTVPLRVTLATAYQLAGNDEAAIEQFEWIIAQRGRAFAEYLPEFFGRELGILNWLKAHYRLGALYEKRNEYPAAEKMYLRVREHWAHSDKGIGWLRKVEEKLAAITQTSSH